MSDRKWVLVRKLEPGLQIYNFLLSKINPLPSGLLPVSHLLVMSFVADLPTDFWLFSLLSNIFSFAVVIAPAALIIRHVKNNPHKMAGQSLIHSILRLCVQGQDDGQPVDAETQKADALAEAQQEDAEDFTIKVCQSASYCFQLQRQKFFF